jgi:hypothetical protein
MALTATQRAIAQNMNLDPDEMESKMSAIDPDDDTESSDGDELDGALNHLGASEPGDDDHLDHVQNARDLLSRYLARKGRESKSANAAAAHHVAFPPHVAVKK